MKTRVFTLKDLRIAKVVSELRIRFNCGLDRIEALKRQAVQPTGADEAKLSPRICMMQARKEIAGLSVLCIRLHRAGYQLDEQLIPLADFFGVELPKEISVDKPNKPWWAKIIHG